MGAMNTKAEKNILRAFVKLYQKKDLGEISVKEICIEAGVSRVTFYTYYEDIGFLLSEIEEKILFDAGEIFKAWSYVDLSKVRSGTPVPILVDFFTYMHQNMDIFRALYKTHSHSQFIKRFYKMAEETFLEALDRYGPGSLPSEVSTAFCVGALKYAEELWLSGKIKATPDEFALMIQKVIVAILSIES
jgi:AcrR family transcriptional regulator